MQELRLLVGIATHALLLAGCSEAQTLPDAFRASDYRNPPGRELEFVLKAPIVVLGVVSGIQDLGAPKPAREDPRLLVQLTHITIRAERVLKGPMSSGTLSFYYYTFSRRNRLDLGIRCYLPSLGERRLFFLEASGDIYRSVGDVADYTLAVRSGLPDRAVGAGESLGCRVAKTLLVPGQRSDSESFALGLHEAVHVSDLLCSREVTRQLLNDLMNLPDGTVFWQVAHLIRSETE